MPETVQSVVAERRSEDEFSGVFDGFGDSVNELNHIGGGEGLRGNEVGKGVAVKH